MTALLTRSFAMTATFGRCLRGCAQAALVALAFAMPAQAETLAFPAEAPVASLDVPEGWDARETATGMQAFSPESAIAFYIDITPIDDREKVVKDAFVFLLENDVVYDIDSQEESKGALNGLPAVIYNYDGDDKEGPVVIGLYLVQVSETTALVGTYWGAKDVQDTYGPIVAKMLNTLKAEKG